MRKYIFSLLVPLLVLIGATSASAQEQTVELDRRNIIPCPSESFMDVAIANPTFTLWTADHAGINPLNPAVRTARPRTVAEYIRGPRPGERYSDRERATLTEARAANEASFSLLSYTAKGTALEQVPPVLSNNEYDNVVVPSMAVLTEEVYPCGTVLELGVTAARRNVKGQKVVSILPGPIVVGWYERGVKTRDGKPGIRVLVGEIFRPTYGPNAGVPMRGLIVRNCGNTAIRFEQVKETVTVTTPAPVVERTPQGITVPPPAPPPPPPPPAAPTADLQGNPLTITEGDNSVLTWTTTGVDSPILDPVGRVGATGTVRVSPRATTTYRLTASNETATATDSVTVTVIPRPIRVPRQPVFQQITVGSEVWQGMVHSNYEEAIPTSGDVPQRHSFRVAAPVVRFDRNNGTWIFGSVQATAFGSTSGMEFQDSNGAWNTKKREVDTSQDQIFEAKAGWKHPIGPNLIFGAFGGYQRLCLCEDYTSGGAATTTKRSYSGLIVGAEAIGSTPSEDHRITVAVSGEIGPRLTRSAWTKQVYGEIDFPKVVHDDEAAVSYGLDILVSIQMYRAVHFDAGYKYFGISSTRPNTNTAHERVNMNAVVLGMSMRWGRLN